MQGHGRGQVSDWSGHFQKDPSMKQQWDLQQGFSAKPTQFGDCSGHIISGSNCDGHALMISSLPSTIKTLKLNFYGCNGIRMISTQAGSVTYTLL